MFNATNPCAWELPLALDLPVSQVSGTNGEAEIAAKSFTALLEDEPRKAIFPSGAEPLAGLPVPAVMPPGFAPSNNRAAEFDTWQEGALAPTPRPMVAASMPDRAPEVLLETTGPQMHDAEPIMLEQIAPECLQQMTGRKVQTAPPFVATRAEVMEKLDPEDAVTAQAQSQTDLVQSDLPIKAQREGQDIRHADTTPADLKIDMSWQNALPEAGPAPREVGDNHTVKTADVATISDDVLLPEAGALPAGTTGIGETADQPKAPIDLENANQAPDEASGSIEVPHILPRPQDRTEWQDAPADVHTTADRPADPTPQFAGEAKILLEHGRQIVSLKVVPAEAEALWPAARGEMVDVPVAQPAGPYVEGLWSMVVAAAHEDVQGLGEQTGQAELTRPHVSALNGMPTPGGAPDTAMAPSQKGVMSPEPNVNALPALTDGPATLLSPADQARAATDAVLGPAPTPTPTSADAPVARAFAPAPAPHPPHLRQMAEALLTQTNTEQPGRIDLTLSPETLGRVRFDMRHDQAGLSIVLSAERPETLDLVRRNLPELIAELKQAGIEAGSFSFSGWNEQRRPPTPDDDLQHLPRDAATLKPAIQAAPPAAALRPSVAAGGLDMRI